jgi:hypothetical protein
MNRRHLFALMAGAIMTPEGLWVPGQKTIFLPAKERFLDHVGVVSWGNLNMLTVYDPNRRSCGLGYGLFQIREKDFHPMYERHPGQRLSYINPRWSTVDVHDIPASLWKCNTDTPARLFEQPNGTIKLRI